MVCWNNLFSAILSINFSLQQYELAKDGCREEDCKSPRDLLCYFFPLIFPFACSHSLPFPRLCAFTPQADLKEECERHQNKAVSFFFVSFLINHPPFFYRIHISSRPFSKVVGDRELDGSKLKLVRKKAIFFFKIGIWETNTFIESSPRRMTWEKQSRDRLV